MAHLDEPDRRPTTAGLTAGDRNLPTRPAGRPALDAVLLDFHGTLAQVEDPLTWVRAAMHACGLLGVDPRRALMVGDTPADAGATAAGCTSLVLPAAGPGESNGLGAVRVLTGVR